MPDFADPSVLAVLKELPVIGIVALIILGGLWFLSKSLLPSITFLLSEQKAQRAWYENTLMPTMAQANQAHQHATLVISEAYQSKLEAVQFELNKKFEVMMEERNRERDELKGRVAILEKGIADRDAAIARMESEITVLREEHEKALSKIRQSEGEIRELKEYNSQKDARIAELKTALDRTTDERNRFAAELELVKTRLEELSRAQIATDQTIQDNKDGKGGTPEGLPT